MISVCDILVVVLVATKAPTLLVLKFTLTDATHCGGAVVLQVTLAAGVEPFTLSALTVTVESAKVPAVCIRHKMQIERYIHDGVSSKLCNTSR